MTKRKMTAGTLIRLILVILALLIIVVGALWQVCAKNGIDFLWINYSNSGYEGKIGAFNVDKLQCPAGMEDAEDKTWSSELCLVEELQNNGIKLSNAYYIVDEGVEQVRLRYGLSDKNSEINLLVRGILSLQDGAGGDIKGIFGALTDNYGGYRSQVVTINLANTEYAGASGETITLNVVVETTEFSGQFRITLP